MLPAPIPEDDAQRLAELHALGLLDSASEPGPPEGCDPGRGLNRGSSTLLMAEMRREFVQLGLGVEARYGNLIESISIAALATAPGSSRMPVTVAFQPAKLDMSSS